MLTLADKNITMWLLPSGVEDIDAPKVSEISAGSNISQKVFKQDTYLRPTASEAVSEPLLSGDPAQGYGQDNFEGQLNVGRFYDTDGKPDATLDTLWTAAKAKGTPLTIAMRYGAHWNTAPVSGQEVSVYEVTTDNPQPPQDLSGFIKRIIPLAVMKASLDVALAS